MLQFATGDDWIVEGSIVKADGTPLDLTAATLSLIVSDARGAVAVAAQNATIVTAAAGTWRCVVPRALTAALVPAYYSATIQVEQSLLRQEYRVDVVNVVQGVIP
jgi:hypothetical protein